MLYWIGWSLSRVVAVVFGRARYIGAKNIPKTGAVILAPNHVSYIDPPTVGSGIRRQVRFMAKEELFRVPILGYLIRCVGAFPVKQKTADRGAIRKALDLLAQGEVVCIFPEGSRSGDGSLQEPESGLGLIALKSQAPIVPVALINTERLLPAHSIFLRFAKVKVIYGETMTFDDLCEKGVDKAAVEQVGRRVMAEIARLRSEHSSS